MIWRSNWRCLTRFYKAAAADSKCGSSLRSRLALSRQFGDKAATEPDFNRDFLARLWMADREMERIRRKTRGKAVRQPPLSQSISEYLEPESPEEVHFFTTLGKFRFLLYHCSAYLFEFLISESFLLMPSFSNMEISYLCIVFFRPR